MIVQILFLVIACAVFILLPEFWLLNKEELYKQRKHILGSTHAERAEALLAAHDHA